MPRHGDCQFFMPDGASIAAEEGTCMEMADEDGFPAIVNIYEDIKDCPKFKEIERVKTDSSEEMWGPAVRAGRGFDEK
ncbi:MAG: hypothetical protein J7K30_09485 [Deltaproteobacteria bacterium]|nr:hypothetical protein [Deltaproteobacteria bacterium]